MLPNAVNGYDNGYDLYTKSNSASCYRCTVIHCAKNGSFLLPEATASFVRLSLSRVGSGGDPFTIYYTSKYTQQAVVCIIVDRYGGYPCLSEVWYHTGREQLSFVVAGSIGLLVRTKVFSAGF